MNTPNISTPQPTGKTILITGGNRGIGRAVAIQLANQGHHILLAGRNFLELNQVKNELPAGSCEVFQVELSDFSRVRRLAEKLQGRKIDVLYHIAGVMQQSPTRKLGAQGFEETLTVNALSPLLLSLRLLPELAQSPDGRILFVSSSLHFPNSRGEPVHFDWADPDLEKGYHPDRAYKNSKLAVLWVAYELDRQLRKRGALFKHLSVQAICPGFVPETAAASTTGFMNFYMKHILKWMPFAARLETAAKNLAALAVNPIPFESNFWSQGRVMSSSEESKDAAKAAKFWTLAQARFKLEPRPSARERTETSRISTD